MHMDLFCACSRRVCWFAGVQVLRNIVMVRTCDQLQCAQLGLSTLLGCMIVDDGQGGLHRVLWWDCEVVACSDLELYHGVPCCYDMGLSDILDVG